MYTGQGHCAFKKLPLSAGTDDSSGTSDLFLLSSLIHCRYYLVLCGGQYFNRLITSLFISIAFYWPFNDE